VSDDQTPEGNDQDHQNGVDRDKGGSPPPPPQPPPPQPPPQAAPEPQLPPGPLSPILREEELKRWRVTGKRPTPRANTRLVFVDGKGRTYAPEQPVTLGEAVWGRLQRVYEVDLKEHPAGFRDRLPCREKGFYFEVEFSLYWKIHDPETIVLDGRSDVRPLYERSLRGRISEYSETFGLEQRLQAEQQLNGAFRQIVVLDQGVTLSRCGVSLSLGEEAEEHLRNRTRARFDHESRGLEHEADLHRTGLEESLLKARMEIEVLKGEQRTTHKKRHLEEQVEINRLRHQLERQEQMFKLELKAERLQQHKLMLEDGNYEALFLDARPDDVGELINFFLSRRREEQNNARQMLQAMLDSGLVNGADIDEPRRIALTKVLEGLNTSAADSITGRRTAPAIAPAKDTGPPKTGKQRKDADEDDDDD
jgi:hypothetical protein